VLSVRSSVLPDPIDTIETDRRCFCPPDMFVPALAGDQGPEAALLRGLERGTPSDWPARFPLAVCGFSNVGLPRAPRDA